ncbi:MAG TPA: cupin domain-containing protein [Solirubrobacterales bacterium]|jgi:mannose-6-phosphate isomerase-like protein (cupin superfamily)
MEAATVEATAQSTKPKIVGPKDGKAGSLGAVGVRFMIDGAETNGDFSLVEHPMPPRQLAAPVHIHTREDEYSYVLSGRMGALLGDEVVYAEPGDLVFKPRNQWHTFWNAGDTECRILEIISPAGFEKFFEALADMNAAGPPDPEKLVALADEYGHYYDLEATQRVIAEHGLSFPLVMED